MKRIHSIMLPGLLATSLAAAQPSTIIQFDLNEGDGTRLVAQGNPAFSSNGSRLSWDADLFYINDQAAFPYGAEAHYFRIPPREWEDRIIKIKNAGINTVSICVVWARHEPREGIFDFSGQMDLARYIGLCRKHGLMVHLRIGPYINSELNHGGLPHWLYTKHDFTYRLPTKQFYLDLVHRYYGKLAEQVKEHFPSRSGNIILVQLDNEMNEGTGSNPSYHEDGQRQMNTLMRYAKEFGFEGPFSGTSWGHSPTADGSLKLIGEYPGGLGEPNKMSNLDQYDIKKKYGLQTAVFDAEHGAGTVHWGLTPARLPAAHAVAMLGRGVGGISYYMFSGGSHPQPYIDDPDYYYGYYKAAPLNYDYSAPIGQYGQTRESYLHIKRNGQFLGSYGASVQNGRHTSPSSTGGLVGKQVGFRGKNASGFIYMSPYRIPDDQASEQLAFRMQLAQSTVQFPRFSNLTATQCQAMIFPFRMAVDGLDLLYATAQPLVRMARKDGQHMVFWGSGKVEYCFEHLTRADVAYSKHVDFHQDGDRLVAVVDASSRQNILVISRPGKPPAIVKTLSDADALHAYQLAGVTNKLVIAPGIVPLGVDAADGKLVMHYEYVTNAGDSRVVSLYPGNGFGARDYSTSISDQLVKLKILSSDLKFTNNQTTLNAADLPPNMKELFIETTPMNHDKAKLYVDDAYSADQEHIRDEHKTLYPWQVGLRNHLTKRRYAWLLEDQGDGNHVIFSRFTRKAIDASSHSASVRQLAPNASDAQKWKLKPTGDGHVKIRNVKTGLLLTQNGGNVIQSPDVNGVKQMWKVEFIHDGYSKIVSKTNGVVLDGGTGQSDDANPLVVVSREDTNIGIRLENIGYARSFYRLKDSVTLGVGPIPPPGMLASLLAPKPAPAKRPFAPAATYDGRVWDFLTDLEGWTMNPSVTEHHIPLGGEIFFKIIGPDPHIASPDNLNVDAASYKSLYLRIRNATADTSARLYWVTTADGSYDESKARTIKLSAHDAEYKEYAVDLGSHPSWKGVIRRLRLDLADTATSGQVDIEKIILANKISHAKDKP